MKFCGPMLCVRDMEASKRFYTGLFGQKLVLDYGENVTFDGGFSIQVKYQEICGLDPERFPTRYGGNDAELYFEEPEFDRFLEKLAAWPGIEYILPCHEHNWGQRCVCFYDPDRHIIEVGEPMDHVAARFLKQGMRPEQVAERTMVPLEIVLKIQKAIGE